MEAYSSDGDMGKFVTKDCGYTLAGNTKPGSTRHKDVANEVPIFTREPNQDDVNQGAIGDCYFVAALAAIARTNPVQVYDMIKDNGDGTVTVRMYQLADAASPTAKYFTISKSVVTNDRRSSGALWVPLLEKAYATMGQGYVNKDDTSTDRTLSSVSKSYARIGDGGHSDTAFQVLTGQAVKTSYEKLQATDRAVIPLWSQGEVFKYKLAKYDAMASYVYLNKDQDLTKLWVDFVDSHHKEMSTFTGAEEFESLFKAHNLDLTVTGMVMTDVKARFPGKRGSGKYTPGQIALFDRIATHLNKPGYVAAGTPKKIQLEKKGELGKGHSGGEQVGEGIVGSHAYSVLAARDIDGPKHEPRKYIRLRNPWGAEGAPIGRGRVYTELPDGELDIESDPRALAKNAKPEFDMELTDFMTHFQNLYWG